MAILSKYRKNKKEARNSTMPGASPATPSSAKLSSENVSATPRQVSNSTTSSGAYDQMPVGAPPDTSLEKITSSSSQQQYSPNLQHQLPLQQQRSVSPQNTRSPPPSHHTNPSPHGPPPHHQQQQLSGARSPQQGFRGPVVSPPPPPHSQGFSSPHSNNVQQQQPNQNGRMQAYPSSSNNSTKSPVMMNHPQGGGTSSGGVTPTPQSSNTAAQSQFPWSQNAVQNASPFPRYGHAANAIAARDGEVFVMGGLKGSNVFGDLWVVETDTLTGYLLDTEGCPSPRVGHASLTLGNAFIVFGGDTKIEESDDLDDNLYLLNTTTLKWTIASPMGPRPSGRYGHSISTIGSKVYIFGGQLDDYFFDDLVCYDLTTLRSQSSQWQLIHPNSASPPPRTNHSVVTFQDKLYLFGGTDGKLWYSDTWCYDSTENTWTLLECSGFIPAPCEGHAATIVGDIMYVFGGRSSQGKDLGTLSALKLSTRKWFTFQNLGPGPSPRSGHSMTAFAGHKILVMGGESPGMPSTEDESEDKNHTVFILDTSRINYPVENAPPAIDSAAAASSTGAGSVPTPKSTHPTSANVTPALGNGSGDGLKSVNADDDDDSDSDFNSNKEIDDDAEKLVEQPQEIQQKQLHQQPVQMPKEDIRSPSGMSELAPGVGYERVDVSGGRSADDDGQSATTYESAETEKENGSKTPEPSNRPRSPDVSNIPGAWNSHEESPPALNNDTTTQSSPPQSVTTPRETGNTSPVIRDMSVNKDDEDEEEDGGMYSHVDQSTPRASLQGGLAGGAVGAAGGLAAGTFAKSMSKGENQKQQLSPEISEEQQDRQQQQLQPPPTSTGEALERLKASNTWYESELAAAREAGYVPQSRPPVDILKLRRVSQRLTQDTSGSLQERDILIAALGELKQELQTVQLNVKEQAEKASQRISAAETSRDEALEKLRAAAASGDGDEAQKDLISALESKVSTLEKQLSEAEASGSGSGSRGLAAAAAGGVGGAALGAGASSVMGTGDIEQLKAENLALEKQLRNKTDELVLLQHEMSQLKSDHESVSTKYRDLESTADDKVSALAAASAAVNAAQGRLDESHKQLQDHRQARSELEDQVRQLQSELNDHKSKYESASRELDEHKSLLNHSHEQSTQSSAAMSSGIERIVAMWGASKAFNGGRAKRVKSIRGLQGEEAQDEGESRGLNSDEEQEEEEEDPRVTHLQNRMLEVDELHRVHKEAADKATDDLSRAMQEISMLKEKLANSDVSNSGTQSKLAQALEEMEGHKRDLQESHLRVQEMQDKHATLESERDTVGGRVEELERRLEAELAKNQEHVKQLQKSHQEQYAELENDYEQTMQYMKTNETALKKTRDDLKQHKDLNEQLQAELDELKLRSQESTESTTKEERVASPGSSNKYSTRQVDLQLRDLRAQIIILQDERDELRQSMTSLKKKQINTAQDLEDARAELDRVMEEKAGLEKRTNGGAANRTSGAGLRHSVIVDPESGETLDSYNEELEQLQSERQRIRMSQ